MPRRGRKKPREPKWRVIKKALTEMGFGTDLPPEFFEIQCKDAARQCGKNKSLKTDAQFANFALHLFMHQSGEADVDDDGMGMQTFLTQLKTESVRNVDEDEQSEQLDEPQPRRKPKRGKKRRRSVSEDSDIMVDDELEDKIVPPPSSERRKRRLRDKIEPLEDALGEVPRRNSSADSGGSNPRASEPILEDDLFPVLEEDEEDENEGSNNKPESTKPPKPKPPSPPMENELADENTEEQRGAEDDDFLSSLFVGDENDEESQEIGPPPTMPIESGAEEEDSEEQEAENPPDIKEEKSDKDWEKKEVQIFYPVIDDRTIDFETVIVKETSLKAGTTIKRLKRKIMKHAKLRLVDYTITLKTPEGDEEISQDGSIQESATIVSIRDRFNINFIELRIEAKILIDFKLYSSGVMRDDHIYHKILAYSHPVTVDSMKSEYDDFENDLVWVNGERLNDAQQNDFQFVLGHVYECVFADGSISIPDLGFMIEPEDPKESIVE